MKLHLFGLPKLMQDNKEKSVRLSNPVLLLAYLARKADWVSRSELAFLFRPDDDEVTALKQIRLLLYRAKKLPWTETLESSTKRARFLIDTDVSAFLQANDAKDWSLASQLYTGPFLGDFSSPDLITYNSWLDIERHDLEVSFKDTLSNHAAALEQQGDFKSARQILSDLLKLDRLAEDVIQALLRVTYLASERDKALAIYKRFCEELESEYGAVPLAATQDLAELIRQNEVLEPNLFSDKLSVEEEAFFKLPAQATHFVGRQHDLKALSQLLAESECRLMTIVGFGGMGKTRLAIELANRRHSQFRHGICFVPLASIHDKETLITSITQELGLTLSAHKSPEDQLTEYIADKDFLLILDNFEQLLGATQQLQTLLNTCPNLRLLVTSRERLNLAAEQLYDLSGLSIAEDLEASDAVQLFVNAAKRVAPRLEFASADLEEVADICRQVQGLPLAIELAASWARIMPVSRIKSELSSGYELLENASLDLPERHQNIKMILDTTWDALSEKKRLTLAKCSVFEGGCTLEAAETITQTHFTVLLSLVNESLLQRIPPNRFDMHHLLKQYAKSKLEPASKQQLQSRFSTHFSDQLQTYSQSNADVKLKERAVLMQDIDNLRKNWTMISSPINQAALTKTIKGMYDLYFNFALFYEGKNIFSKTLSQTKTENLSHEPFTANLQHNVAIFDLHLGHVPEAISGFNDALASYQKHENLEDQAEVHRNLGMISRQQGDPESAIEHLSQSLAFFEQLQDIEGKAHALNVMGLIKKDQKIYPDAQAFLEQSLAYFEELKLEDDSAIVNHNLGSVAFFQDQFETAKQHYLASLEVFKTYGFKQGVAASNTNLGNIALKLNQYQEAIEHLEISASLKKEMGDLISLPEPLRQLGLSYLGLKDYKRSTSYFLEALDVALPSQPKPLLLELLIDLSKTVVDPDYANHRYKIITFCKEQKEYLNQEQYDQIPDPETFLASRFIDNDLDLALTSMLERVQIHFAT